MITALSYTKFSIVSPSTGRHVHEAPCHFKKHNALLEIQNHFKMQNIQNIEAKVILEKLQKLKLILKVTLKMKHAPQTPLQELSMLVLSFCTCRQCVHQSESQVHF